MSERNVARVAVVTGAGQGIGRSTSLKLAAQGIHVVLVGRTAAKLERVQAEIGANASIAPLDITDSTGVQALANTLQEQFGRVDSLVNCAGESYLAKLDDTTEQDWDRVLAINLKGHYLMSRAMLPLLRKSQNPSIVNVVSKVAVRGYAPVSAYSAAKAGMLGFSRALAAELRQEEIRVVPLCLGPVDTPMRWAATPQFDRKVVIGVDVVADTVLYLVNLPKGVTTGEIVLQSIHYD